MLFTNYKKMLSSLRADKASLNWQWFEVHSTKVYGLYEQQWRVLVHVSSATRAYRQFRGKRNSVSSHANSKGSLAPRSRRIYEVPDSIVCFLF